jgi:hypothetical protein
LVQQQRRLLDELFRNLKIAVMEESGLARILKVKQARSVVSSFEDS